MKIDYDFEHQHELKALVEERIEEWRWLIPGWLQGFDVTLKHDDENGALGSCSANYAYRWGTVRFSPKMLNQSERDRTKSVVHELVHLLLWPIIQHEKLLVSRKDKLTIDVFRDGLESAVQDMAEALVKRQEDLVQPSLVTPKVEGLSS